MLSYHYCEVACAFSGCCPMFQGPLGRKMLPNTSFWAILDDHCGCWGSASVHPRHPSALWQAPKCGQNVKKSTFPMCQENTKIDSKKARSDPEATFFCALGGHNEVPDCARQRPAQDKCLNGQDLIRSKRSSKRAETPIWRSWSGPLGAAKCCQKLKKK